MQVIPWDRTGSGGLGAAAGLVVADYRDLGGGQANSLEMSGCRGLSQSHAGITYCTTGLVDHSQFPPRKAPNGRVF